MQEAAGIRWEVVFVHQPSCNLETAGFYTNVLQVFSFGDCEFLDTTGVVLRVR